MHAGRKHGFCDQQPLYDVCHAYNVTERQYQAACLPAQGCMLCHDACMHAGRQKEQQFVNNEHRYLLTYANSAMLHIACMQAEDSIIATSKSSMMSSMRTA